MALLSNVVPGHSILTQDLLAVNHKTADTDLRLKWATQAT